MTAASASFRRAPGRCRCSRRPTRAPAAIRPSRAAARPPRRTAWSARSASPSPRCCPMGRRSCAAKSSCASTAATRRSASPASSARRTSGPTTASPRPAWPTPGSTMSAAARSAAPAARAGCSVSSPSSRHSEENAMLRRLLLALVLCFAVAAPAAAQMARIKDLGAFQGVRPNQLVGYGIVVGLAGTGDDNLEYATQGMNGIASRFGLTLPPGVNPALKNAAAVMVTAELPPFARPGQQLDITVSALGRARSLRGGTLILTPLRGADGQIYAMAQGNLAVGGLGVSAQDGSQVSVNVPSAGRIPGGATVERAVETGFATAPTLTFNLAEA